MSYTITARAIEQPDHSMDEFERLYQAPSAVVLEGAPLIHQVDGALAATEHLVTRPKTLDQELHEALAATAHLVGRQPLTFDQMQAQLDAGQAWVHAMAYPSPTDLRISTPQAPNAEPLKAEKSGRSLGKLLFRGKNRVAKQPALVASATEQNGEWQVFTATDKTPEAATDPQHYVESNWTRCFRTARLVGYMAVGVAAAVAGQMNVFGSDEAATTTSRPAVVASAPNFVQSGVISLELPRLTPVITEVIPAPEALQVVSEPALVVEANPTIAPEQPAASETIVAPEPETGIGEAQSFNEEDAPWNNAVELGHEDPNGLLQRTLDAFNFTHFGTHFVLGNDGIIRSGDHVMNRDEQRDFNNLMPFVAGS